MSLSHQYVQDHLLSMHRLNPSEQAALEEHLAACSECRAYAALHQTLRQTLSLPAGSPRPSERDIREKMHTVRARVEKRHWPARIAHQTLSFAGATFGLGLLFLILILTTRTMPGRPAAAPAATPMSAGVPNITATVTAASTPLPTAKPASPFRVSFPMDQGTTWVYRNTNYAQAPSDPEKILQKTMKIEERVVDTQSVSSDTILHIRGSRVVLSTDPGWNETGMAEDNGGNYEFWYVIQNNQVFRSDVRPDLAKMNPLKEMFLSFQFPMSAGSEWCYNPLRRGTFEHPTPDPYAPCESRRVIVKAEPYLAPIGALSSCYEIHDVFNSGDLITQFCERIGIVSVKYGHVGTQFGSDQELIQFTNGKDGSILGALPAVTPNPSYTPAQNRVVPAVAIQDQTAYTGIGPYLAAIDISQPSTPQLAAQSPELPGSVVKVIPLPNGAAPRVAASAGRYLAVFDASTPNDLSLITQSKLPGPITALILDINANRIYAGGTLNSDATKGFIALLDAAPTETLQLLNTLTLDAPVRNLALNGNRLFAALGGEQPGVSAIMLDKDAFGTPKQIIPNQLVYSMTTAGDSLYIGTSGRLLAYRLNGPSAPTLAWQVEQVNGQPLPGPILSFELRPTAIYAARLDASGQPFRLVIPPPEAIKASSTVDTASTVAVRDGLMLVAGERLEIYDILDTPNLKLLGTYPGN